MTDPAVNLDKARRLIDEAQIEACLHGDEEAWDIFSVQATPVIFTAVRRTLERYTQRASIDDVHDLAQDIFLRLVKDNCRLLRNYDSSRSAVSTWLTVIARSSRPSLAALGVGQVAASVLDGAALAAAFEGADVVYHLAGRVSRDPADAATLRTLHVDGTRAVMKAARQQGVGRVVLASTSGTVGCATTPYQVAHDLVSLAEGYALGHQVLGQIGGQQETVGSGYGHRVGMESEGADHRSQRGQRAHGRIHAIEERLFVLL